MIKSFEIDFLPVGTEKSNADSIAINYTEDDFSAPKTILIDGGFSENGELVVEKLQEYYGSTDIEHVVSSHPDIDHISGLIYVLQNCNVKNLWIHLPWKKGTDFSRVSEELLAAFPKAAELVELAESNNIPIYEPY